MDKSTQSLIEAKSALKKRGANPKRAEAIIYGHKNKPESLDPIDRIELPDVRARVKAIPGDMQKFCDVIGKHFERRKNAESFRLIGAIGAAQVIIGNKLKTPTGSKIMFQTMNVARSGSGKGAPMDFVGELANAMGLNERYRSSSVTSTKQLQVHAIEAGGCLVYNNDDNRNHVASWDNDRSPMGETSGFIRSQSSTSTPWEPTAPIQKDISNALSDAMSVKAIQSRSKAEGWIIPRTGEGDDSQIDYERLAQMDHSTGITLARAMRTSRLASRPIEDFKIVPMISLSPDMAQGIVKAWRENGSMGRTFFMYNPDDVDEFKDSPQAWNPTKLVNMWKPRVPGHTITAGWADGGLEAFKQLSAMIDSLRNEDGIVGIVSTRYSQLMIDMATMCAFFDTSARSGNDVNVGVEHLEWAYIQCVDSMRAMRAYMEGEEEPDGLAQTEWDNIVGKLRRIVESDTFDSSPTFAVVKNKLIRDRLKKIVAAADSNNHPMTPEKLNFIIINAIIENKNSPLAVDDMLSSRLIVTENGTWDNLRMNAEVRNVLEHALKKMNISKPRK